MKEQNVQSLTINVTPRQTPHGCECDIAGDRVTDEAISLAKGEDYEINFNLAPDSSWSWDCDDPFRIRAGKCPPRDAPSHPHFEIQQPVGPKKFTVEARSPGNQKRIFHYRLNFEGGDTCDPIIIREAN